MQTESSQKNKSKLSQDYGAGTNGQPRGDKEQCKSVEQRNDSEHYKSSNLTQDYNLDRGYNLVRNCNNGQTSGFKQQNGIKQQIELKQIATISIMCKEHQISIGKDVVRLLAVPKFVTIIMNWDERTMAILSCDEKTATSFKVPDKLLVDRHASFRIYSYSFVKELADRLQIDTEERNYYKGNYSASLHAVVFQL